MINRSQRKSLSILLTLALVVNLFLPFIAQQVKAATLASDLIISEYVEGSNSNKAIELYNGTGQAVDLTEYSLELYTNGNQTVGTTLDFSKQTDISTTLANGETFVIVNASAEPALKDLGDMTHTITFYNGDDALVLKHSGTVIDSFGQVGFDPGSSWGTEAKTAEMTLVRKSTVTSGDTNISDVFVPETEWDAYPQNTYEHIGSHTMAGAPSEEPTKVSAVTASVPSSAVKAGTEVELTTTTEDATIYYTVDGSEPTIVSTVYSAPIAITADTTIKAIAVADSMENSDVAEYTYTVLSLKTISEVRTMNPGDFALTSGVVTAVLGKNIYIQDENAGIVLYGSVSVQPGDEVEAFGEVVDYNSLLELEVSSENVKVLGQKEIPAAKELTAAQLTEQYEAMLVKVGKSKVESFASGNYTAVDANGDSYQLRPGTQEWLEVDTSYDSITGVLGAYRDVHQLIPRTEADIVLDPSFVRPVVATPGAGFVQAGDSVTLSTDTEGATIHYTTDGSEPTASSPVYSAPITVNADMTIKALAVKEGLTSSKVYTYDYIIQKDVVRIYDIQGERHFSKYEGLNVNDVEGVVTYVLGKNDVYIQDLEGDGNDATSDGILVYKSGHGLVPGDVVKVSGQIKEHFIEGYDDRYQVDLPSTEIAASTVEKVRSGETLPAPVVIGVDRTAPTEVIDNDGLAIFDPAEDAIDFYESLEGMLVRVDDAKVVAPQKYGEVVVIPGTMDANIPDGGLRISEGDFNPERITVDMNDESFIAKMGDQFNGSITGVMSYGYSNYKLLTNKANLPELVAGSNEREITSIVPAADKLTVASYNVENFSPKVDAAKVTKLAEAIVKNMKTPDIVGLTEVQDNDGPTDSGTTDASASAALLIQTIKDLGGPTYTYTDIAPVDKTDGGQPGGNIRVGFLYNEDRVELMEAPKGTAEEAVGFENGKLTLNPGRIDPTNPAFEDSRKSLAAQFNFQGESVIVVANHFNSKGGDQPLFGKNQPPVLKSEVQRMEIAKVVNGFVQDVKTKDPNANIILLGDFNDFEFSNPLQTLKGNELVNMVEKVPADQRYSYSYQGNAQVLDHILVTKNLEAATRVSMVHINSGFMEEHGRGSDHDPLLIQTALKAPVVYNKVYNLTGFKTKKLVVGAPNSYIKVDSTSVISEGIWLKKTAKVEGDGLENTKVVISPAQQDTVIDLSGAAVKEVVIDNANVKEIKGAENVVKWTVTDGVDTSGIKFTDSMGKEISSPFIPEEDQTPETSSYYDSAYGKTGADLKSALYNIIKVQEKLSYAQVWEALKETDEDPNNKDNVILLYTGRSQAKTTNGGNADDWNREHVWAKSHGDFGTTVGPGTDIHHLRPTDASVNSSRGNKDFDNGGSIHNECTECRYDGDSWEPPNRVKGDIARMLFYMAVRYEGNGELDLELSDTVNTSPAPLHGKLTTLLEWHKQDPVDEFEKRRNETIYQNWQKNRNPFIDHPEWADLIWETAS
ncbi:chitobiase/beta-hexosaminidase C-terminal domain-containing protein [Mesobacillus jeotgali]|uniref:chitobiase/beta-hexosaminidase C-terminal domain-containing protein n=1 Tax=Mesobacillus jeotgali TaxID=129985 RepID=UPI0017842EFF|nr:chitobiase/beta-hexosaminidase C-terminal domain-containing protein [Mesobacillus jeotgali]UYZ21811.1 endonuclease [Mesobacillus jeotgali]